MIGAEVISNEMQDIEILMIPVDQIYANDWNPNEMSDEMFNRLAADFQEVGFLQPILVSRDEDGRFMIIDGEHRWESAKLMDMDRVPCVISHRLTDIDRQKFQTMRMNQIRGNLNKKKFQALVEDLVKRYPIEDLAENMAYDDVDALRSLISDARAALPTPEMKREFDKAKEEIKTVDDLSLVLNRLFTQYGSTLQYHFMILDFGGKRHLWIRFSDKDKYEKAVKAARVCQDRGVTFSSAVALVMDQINDAFIEDNLDQLEEAVHESDNTIPA